MDKSEVGRLVEKHVMTLARLMGVSYWNVDIELGPCSKPTWGAMCARSTDYEHATITLNPELMFNEESVVRALIHEIAHIMLAPLDTYRNVITTHIDDDTPEHDSEQFLFTNIVEAMVINIERMYRGLTDGRRGPDFMPLDPDKVLPPKSKGTAVMKKAPAPAKGKPAATKGKPAAGKPSGKGMGKSGGKGKAC